MELEKLRGPFEDGLELPCRWCPDFWIFREGEWHHSDELMIEDRIARMTTARLVEARAKRYSEIVGKK